MEHGEILTYNNNNNNNDLLMYAATQHNGP